MQVLMLNPPFLPDRGKFSREQRSPAVTKSGTFYYPMWLASATGVLEQAGHDCRLIDAPASRLDLETLLGDCLKDFRPELAVVVASTPSLHSDQAVAATLKERCGAFTVLVGPHPSALPEETLAGGPGVDAVIRGEYEYVLRELAALLQAGRTDAASLATVAGLSFRQDGKIVHNPPAQPPQDLDALPFVSAVYAKHLRASDYFYAHSKHPIVTIVTSRGCPHHCVYCVYPQTFSGHKLRYRSVKNVADEIEYILKTFPDVQEIMFEDDTLTVNKERCREFAEEILRRGLKFEWSANSRADVDLESMRLLKQAGARLFCVGVESGVQAVLDNMRKKLSVERVRQFFKDAKQAGILVHGCFLVGNPGETKETLQETLRFAKELNPDTAQFFPIMVYPGTEAYAWASQNGYLTTTDFRQWLSEDGMHNCVVSRPGLTSDELVAFCDRARREFYLRPSYIMAKLRQGVSDPYEMKRLTKGAVHLFRNLLPGRSRAACGCRQ